MTPEKRITGITELSNKRLEEDSYHFPRVQSCRTDSTRSNLSFSKHGIEFLFFTHGCSISEWFTDFETTILFR